jgi:hypothetical protein
VRTVIQVGFEPSYNVFASLELLLSSRMPGGGDRAAEVGWLRQGRYCLICWICRPASPGDRGRRTDCSKGAVPARRLATTVYERQALCKFGGVAKTCELGKTDRCSKTKGIRLSTKKAGALGFCVLIGSCDELVAGYSNRHPSLRWHQAEPG